MSVESKLLICPKCNEKMELSNCDMVETSKCFYCNGTWINKNAFSKLLDKENKTTLLSMVEQSANQNNTETAMKCPVCINENLYRTKPSNNIIDACLKCGGVFLSEEEIKKILPNTYVARNMDSQKERKLNKYVNVSYIGLLFIIISMILDKTGTPGEVLTSVIGFLLLLYGIGLSSIKYYRWKK